jgi:hypothetical protein
MIKHKVARKSDGSRNGKGKAEMKGQSSRKRLFTELSKE